MSADWHDTIQRYMSGSTTREESEALEDALKNDAELRLLYLDYLNLDLALEAKAETSGELAEIVPISDLNSAPASSRKPMRSVLAIAAVFALLLSLATLFFKPTSEPAAWVWQATGTQTVSVGESLSPGRVVNLLSGQVRIRFAWGAILAVESPAEFTILGQNSARLIRGQATVRVPGKKKGFTVVTPTERVIDLGTSFGVDVARSGATEISVFEGEVKLGAEQRLTAGQSVEVAEARSEPKEIPYSERPYADTWQISFGVEALSGKMRVASPSERRSPGKVQDSESLLLFPERERVPVSRGYRVDAMEQGLHQRPFRKRMITLTEDQPVDSFLLQYNPERSKDNSEKRRFEGELRFDRPIVALILQKELLDASDKLMALPDVDFQNIFRRGINVFDQVELSADRRTLRIAFDLKDGVDQIRVLVASDTGLM